MSKSAVPLLVGAGALAVVAASKKKKSKSKGHVRWGIRISSDCKQVDVVDPKLFDQFLYGAFNEMVAADPEFSLIQITDALFGDIAPHCSGFPEEPESAQVAELYAVIARQIGMFMVWDPRLNVTMGSLIDDATKISFVDWYRAWRNYPSSDVPEAPASQVAFSSDLSSYDIGSKWYEETVLPFVAQSAAEGRVDSAFEDFVAFRGVKVGQFVMPISELPQDSPVVVEFLDTVEEAIDQAIAELSG